MEGVGRHTRIRSLPPAVRVVRREHSCIVSRPTRGGCLLRMLTVAFICFRTWRQGDQAYDLQPPRLGGCCSHRSGCLGIRLSILSLNARSCRFFSLWHLANAAFAVSFALRFCALPSCLLPRYSFCSDVDDLRRTLLFVDARRCGFLPRLPSCRTFGKRLVAANVLQRWVYSLLPHREARQRLA